MVRSGPCNPTAQCMLRALLAAESHAHTPMHSDSALGGTKIHGSSIDSLTQQILRIFQAASTDPDIGQPTKATALARLTFQRAHPLGSTHTHMYIHWLTPDCIQHMCYWGPHSSSTRGHMHVCTQAQRNSYTHLMSPLKLHRSPGPLGSSMVTLRTYIKAEIQTCQ